MVRREDLTEQNVWWKYPNDFEQRDADLARISRFIDPLDLACRTELDLKPANIYLIRGPRRAGKTTYLKQLILRLLRLKSAVGKAVDARDVFYVNVERLKIKRPKELHKTLRFFLEMRPSRKFIFIDEITSCGKPEEWAGVIQGFYDTGELKDSSVVLTGSDPFVLEEGANKLAGRGLSGNDYIFRPLSFRDFVITAFSHHRFAMRLLREQYGLNGAVADIISGLGFSLNDDLAAIKKTLLKSEVGEYEKELRTAFGIYLLTGGFPQAINQYFERSLMEKERPLIGSDLYEDILRAILEKLESIGKEAGDADDMISALVCEKHIAGGVSYSSIAKEVGKHSQTVEQYIHLLNQLLIVDVLNNYREKSEDRQGYLKKIYLSDPFLVHSLTTRISGRAPFFHSTELLEKEEYKAALVEMVSGTAMRGSEEVSVIKAPSTYLFFYKDETGELDFVFRRDDGSVVGIEVSYQEEPSTSDVKKTDFIKQYIQLTKSETSEFADVIQVPAPVFLTLLKKSKGCV